ncbi:Retrograde regulation protein 1 [Nakaseomyces bracarensis]|uniref:Retrograde regulation protein 1 n=1 Tax=Nakaseomyces bracarensis TaxID=273131 RepID=A0ABR4NQ48_9SACH
MTTPVSQSVSSGGSGKNSRKRHDNMTDKIQELLRLIPEEFFHENYGSDSGGNGSGSVSGETPGGTTPKLKATGTKDGRPNKGQILTQSVEYITHLQNQVDSNNREEIELMMKVSELAKQTGTIINDINLENTSAEIALANIGVGPLAGATSEGQEEDGQDAARESTAESTGSFMQSNDDTAGNRGSPNKAQMSKFEYGGYAEYAS